MKKLIILSALLLIGCSEQYELTSEGYANSSKQLDANLVALLCSELTPSETAHEISSIVDNDIFHQNHHEAHSDEIIDAVADIEGRGCDVPVPPPGFTISE